MQEMFINWSMSCICCVCFFSITSSTPLSLSLAQKGFHAVMEKGQVPSVARWHFWRTFLHPFIDLSVLCFCSNISKCSNCLSRLPSSLSFSLLLFDESDECQELLGLGSSIWLNVTKSQQPKTEYISLKNE